MSLNAFQSDIAECVGSIFCALHERQAAHPRHQLQFISATTAANQMTVPQGSSKAAISSQLSLTKEKIIPSAFFKETSCQPGKSRVKNRFLRNVEAPTRNFSKVESGELFAENCAGKKSLLFLDALIYNWWRFLGKSNMGSEAHKAWKGYTETLCLQEVYFKFPHRNSYYAL